MTEVWFYHLERRSVDQELPGLLQRGLDRKLLMAVQVPDADRIRTLSAALWAFEDVGFLPHGANTDDGASTQPIVLLEQGAAANAADYLFCVDGAEPLSFEGITRATIMFDGAVSDHVDRARGLWKRCKAQGHSIRYWKQDESGRWADQAS
jgi:DNA polymerase III subunit chi